MRNTALLRVLMRPCPFICRWVEVGGRLGLGAVVDRIGPLAYISPKATVGLIEIVAPKPPLTSVSDNRNSDIYLDDG